MVVFLQVRVVAQDKEKVDPPFAADLKPIQEQVDKLRAAIDALRGKQELQSRDGQALLADVAVFEKAVSWILRFEEFPKKDYIDQLRKVLEKGTTRAEKLQQDKADVFDANWHLDGTP